MKHKDSKQEAKKSGERHCKTRNITTQTNSTMATIQPRPILIPHAFLILCMGATLLYGYDSHNTSHSQKPFKMYESNVLRPQTPQPTQKARIHESHSRTPSPAPTQFGEEIHESMIHESMRPHAQPKWIQTHESLAFNEIKPLFSQDSDMNLRYITRDSSLSTKVQNDKSSESVFAPQPPQPTQFDDEIHESHSRTPSPAPTQFDEKIHESYSYTKSATPTQFDEEIHESSLNATTNPQSESPKSHNVIQAQHSMQLAQINSSKIATTTQSAQISPINSQSTNTKSQDSRKQDSKQQDSRKIAEQSSLAAMQDSKQVSLIYGLDFLFFADNLEGSRPYWDTRTLLQVSIAPEIGLHFYGQNLRVGGYYIMNMGEAFPKRGGLSLYYDMAYKDFRSYFGIFPRKHWIGTYPALYYRKDFIYQNPMINGLALQYQSDTIEAEFIFDWYGGNLQKRIDEFLGQGFFRQKLWRDNLFFGGSFLLYHTKNDELLNPNSSVLDVWLLDRLYYHAFVGFDLQKEWLPMLDSFEVNLGLLGSVERKRRHSSGLDPFSNHLGTELTLKIQYKGFGIENSLYYGQGQMQYFSEYGEQLYWGIPFYQARLYDRAEAYWEWANEYLKARVSFILHCTEAQIGNAQMITIKLDTEKLLKKAAHSL